MNTNLASKLLRSASLVMAAGSLAAAAPPAMRDAATHDELSMALRVASNADPLVVLKPAPGPDPSKVNMPEGIISQSDFLSFGGRATLVPKRAILQIPPNLADRVKLQPGSMIQTWAEFYAMNRAWITTVEVTRIQAGGNEALAEELTKRIGKSSNLIVATYQSGPISVLPLKVAAAPADATTTPAATAVATAAASPNASKP
jgi:hypothetical protein